MTWLSGTSTLGAFPALFGQLVTGATADGGGHTCASGDQWVFDNGGTTTIRTPTAQDITPATNWQMRAGYFAMFSTPNLTQPGNNTGQLSSASVCKVTSPFTTNPASSHNRWAVGVEVSTANTVPGNYSTAKIGYTYWEPDTNVVITNLTAQALSSTGAITMTNGLQIQLTDPSGTLVVSTSWARGFTTTLLYGIDLWPLWSRRGSGVTAPSFGTSPAGVASTDYTIVDEVIPTSTFAWTAGTLWDASCVFSGLGIQTSTGLNSNGLYTGSFPIALAKCRLYAGASLGLFGLDPGPSPVDSVNGTVNRPSGCTTMPVWLKCIQTPASATSSTALQYFISCKATGIYLILNADPAGTGKLGTAYIGTFTPYDTTYDVLPVMTSTIPIDYTGATLGDATSALANQPYWLVRRMQDTSVATLTGTATGSSTTTLTDSTQARATNQDAGYVLYAGTSFATIVSNTATVWTVSSWTGGTPSTSATYRISRDWQTGFMRLDFGSNNTGYHISGGTNNSTQTFMNNPGYQYSALGQVPAGSNLPQSQVKPNMDGNWWLYGFNYIESSVAGAGVFNNGITPIEQSFIRGYQNTRFLALPSTGWGNGDTLTDSITSNVYLCLTPDYAAAAYRSEYGTNLYAGGIAVLEV